METTYYILEHLPQWLPYLWVTIVLLTLFNIAIYAFRFLLKVVQASSVGMFPWRYKKFLINAMQDNVIELIQLTKQYKIIVMTEAHFRKICKEPYYTSTADKTVDGDVLYSRVDD